MSLVLVSERQFILAESILDISISENYDYNYAHQQRGRGRKKSALDSLMANEEDNLPIQNYSLMVEYVPVGWGAQGHCSSRTHSITVKDKATALKLFKELVDQYREQNPDELYLQKAMDRILGEQKDDGSTEEVRGAGEA